MSFLSSIHSPFSELEPEPILGPPAFPSSEPAAPAGLTRAEISRLVAEETAVNIASTVAALNERAMRSREEVDAKLAEAIARVEAYARPRVAVMAVKFPGDTVARKLSKEAHPFLPTALNILKGVRPNILLIGPRGSGKTTFAEQVSEAMGLPYAALTITAGASETWLLGRVLNGEYVPAAFSAMYEKGGVFLLDEIDAADPNMGCMLNTALENGSFYNPIAGRMMKRHPDFYVVGAANTNMRGGSVQYSGRSRQDAALVERFFAVQFDYNREMESRLSSDKAILDAAWAARDALKRVNSQESISTRGILTLERALAIGLPMDVALYNLQLGWNDAAVKTADLENRVKAGA